MGSPMYIFPAGRAGAGLLLLRFGVAGSGLAIASSAAIHPGWLFAFCLAIAVPIAAGARTRTLAVLSAAMLLLAFAYTANNLEMLALHVICAVAVALTGPGAYSLDSALFGRRQIVLPSMDDSM